MFMSAPFDKIYVAKRGARQSLFTIILSKARNRVMRGSERRRRLTDVGV
jgi:hypothetical protein